MSRNHKAPQYNVACVECLKIHPSSSISGLQKEAEDRVAKESQNIDHERSFMNLTIHGLDVFGNPVVNHDKPETSLEERIYKRIEEVGAKVRRDRQEISVERGHNSKESVICEGIIFQVSHERSMEILAEDGMLDENRQIRKDRHLPKDGKMYSLFMDTYRFACERFGADNVVGAYIHLDEYTPHMHVFVVPVTMKESRYRGEVRKDEFGQPIMKGVLDAKNIFSPSTIKQLWPDYAEYIEKYGVSKAEGKVPKGMYTEVATMDAVIEQKQTEIQQKEYELQKQQYNLDVNELTSEMLHQEIAERETISAELRLEIADKQQQSKYLELQIKDRNAELDKLQKQLKVTSTLGSRPVKGVLGYRTEDVDKYAAACEAKNRLKEISQIKIDDLPTKMEMKKQLDELQKRLSKYECLMNNPDAMQQRAQEKKEEKHRNAMYALANAALGGDLIPTGFSCKESTDGASYVVVGHSASSGNHRAVHIRANGMVYSTSSSSVRDVESATMNVSSLTWTSHGTIHDLYLQIKLERIINNALISQMHFLGYEKRETANGAEYLFYGSNALNYFRDINGNVRSAYAKNIPDIKTCHERKDDCVWKFEVNATAINRINQYRDKGVKK